MEIIGVRTSDPDRLAGVLAMMGRLGRRMPPAWDGARISVPVCGPGGEYVGRVLPGRGLLLAHDLKHVGITRPIANVLERTPVMKLRDFFASERLAVAWAAGLAAAALFPKAVPGILFGAVAKYGDVIAQRGGGKGEDRVLSKASATTVANAYFSLFQSGGFPPAGTYTAIPGGAAPTRASTGAWSLGLTNPTAPNKKYLLTLGFTAAQQINILMLVDLLVAAGSINANLATSQTINSTALTRYTDGKGVMMTFDVTTALGATASNLTVSSYTNQDGTAARTTLAVAMTPSGIVQRLQPDAAGPFMVLQSGDYGVRSVETLIFSAAMGAGVVALNLYFPIMFMPGIAANTYVERDSTIQIDALTELVQTSGGVLGCLAGYILAGAASSGVLTASMRTVEG